MKIKGYNIVSVNRNYKTTTTMRKRCSIENFYLVNINRDGMTGMTRGVAEPKPFINSERREKILNWCHENCQKHWSEEGILQYVFEDEEESILFALRWA